MQAAGALRVPDLRPVRISPEHWPRLATTLFDSSGAPTPEFESQRDAWLAEARKKEHDAVLGLFLILGFLLWFVLTFAVFVVTGGFAPTLLIMGGLTLSLRVWLGVRSKARLQAYVRHLDSEMAFLSEVAATRSGDPSAWKAWTAYCARAGTIQGFKELGGVFAKGWGLFHS